MEFAAGIPLELKFLSAAGEIEGYASLFGGAPDVYGDLVERGAFRETLAEHASGGRKVKLLWQHDASQPIGVWDELIEDEKGLRVKGRLLTEISPKAQEVHGLLKAGAIDGLSIGYDPIETAPVAGKPTLRALRKVDLWEVSLVTFPANGGATVTGVKSFDCARDFADVLHAAGLSRRQAKIAAGAAWKAINESDETAEIARLFDEHAARLAAATGGR